MVNELTRHIKNGTFISAMLFRVFSRYSLSEKNVFRKQEKLLSTILKEAVRHCEYYKKYDKFCSLKDFPVVDKKLISDNFELFVNERSNHFEYKDAYTGGSTGEPFHLFMSGGYEREFGLRKWEKFGYKIGDKILAMDGTKIADELVNKNIFWVKKSEEDIPFGSWALSSLYLNERNARKYCDFIAEFSPQFIRGYPAFIYSIACYLKDYGIKLNGIKGIELTSETTLDFQISKIKEVFECPVFLQYGHTEACVFAYTYDEQYKYRVEPLYGYVEILDEHEKHVQEGEIGEIVVTTLHNYVMPLIRYRTGDFAEYGGRDQRYIYLNNVLGRTQDYIINKSGDAILLTALIFGQHMKALGNINKWQIEQYEIGKIVIRIVKNSTYTKKDENEIKNLIGTIGNVEVKIEYVNHIALTPRGKSKMLIQHLS